MSSEADDRAAFVTAAAATATAATSAVWMVAGFEGFSVVAVMVADFQYDNNNNNILIMGYIKYIDI